MQSLHLLPQVGGGLLRLFLRSLLRLHPCLLPLRAGQKRLLARRRHLRCRAPCGRLQPLELGPELRQRLFGVARLRLQRARLVRVSVSLVRVRGLA